jgi:hypothetical protein
MEVAMRALIPLLVPALVLVLGACGVTQPGVRSAPSGSAATVQVNNHNWSDMVVYLVRSSMRIRLGTVTSMGSREFRLPNAVVEAGVDIHLQAEPIGSRERYRTPALQVRPGQQVELTLQNRLSISSVSVW